MKKTLVILFALLFLVSGCGNKEEKAEVKDNDSKAEEVFEENNTKNDGEEETKQEENEEQPKEEETSKNNTTTNKNETTETKQPDKNNNQTTNKEQTTSKNEQTQEEQKPACTPKKFANKYSYVYEDKATCMKEGNLKFLDISDNTDPEIFAYNCVEIEDDCKNKYYGVVFYKWSEEKGEYPVYY